MDGRRAHTPETIAEIAARYAAGDQVVDLAREYRIAKTTVVRYARECGVKVRSTGRQPTAEWRASWWWDFAREQWPEDAHMLDTVACREIYGPAAVTAACKMKARYEAALAVLRLDPRALAAARKAAAE